MSLTNEDIVDEGIRYLFPTNVSEETFKELIKTALITLNDMTIEFTEDRYTLLTLLTE